MTVRRFSPVPAITSVTDLQKHSVFSTQIRITRWNMYTRHHGEWPHVWSVRSSWFMVTTADLSCLRELLRHRLWSSRSSSVKKESWKKQTNCLQHWKLQASVSKWTIQTEVRDSNLQSRKCVVFRFVLNVVRRISRTDRLWSAVVTQEKNMLFPSMSWLPKFRKFLISCRKRCWNAHVHIVTLILMLQQTTKNSKIPSTTNRDLSKLCGAETASVRTRSKKMFRQHPDVCRLSRNT